MISYDDFLKIQIRVGTVLEVEDFPRAKKPSFRLKIDFGPLGIKVSSAQITDFYSKDELRGKQVVAVTNFPPKNIAGFLSEVLVLGAVLEDGKVVLLEPEREVPNGTRVL
ncbi:MAG: tRNA-binding protein [Caldiserica bacterium]|jgi:tRNA-binding protein|nr:tRNA-binding protein [Caldisericota bacterium]MDH7562424.1 tRNA-binding protein [Caldisericota bacterium]